MEIAAAKKKQTIPKMITQTTPSTAKEANTFIYPDNKLWDKSLHCKLDKTDKQVTVKWLKPKKLGIISKWERIILLKLSINNKRQNRGDRRTEGEGIHHRGQKDKVNSI